MAPGVASPKLDQQAAVALPAGGDLCFFPRQCNNASELGSIGGRSDRLASDEKLGPLPALDNALAGPGTFPDCPGFRAGTRQQTRGTCTPVMCNRRIVVAGRQHVGSI
jgi:hypothetical protein